MEVCCVCTGVCVHRRVSVRLHVCTGVSDCAWAYQIVRGCVGCVRAYQIVHGHVRLCAGVSLSGYMCVRVCQIVHGRIRLCAGVSDCAWAYQIVHGHVRLCAGVSLLGYMCARACQIVHGCVLLCIPVHNIHEYKVCTTVEPVYSGHLGTPKNCPYYRGVLISQSHSIHIYIAMGPQLTVLIIEVSLFQSVHNSRFDCIY